MPTENQTKIEADIEDTAQTVDASQTEEEAKAADDAAPQAEEPAGDDDWSEEDLRLLSDEERAALFDDEDGDDTAQEDDADAADKGDDQGEPAAQEASDDDAADDAAEITGTQGTDIASIDAEIEALEAAKVAAFDAWEDGDLTREEYLSKLKETDDATKQAVSRRAVAESQEQAVYTSFINTAKGYFGENPDLATPEHAEAYDRHVRAVTGSPQYQHMTHRQMLEAAHKLYAAEADVLGVTVPAPKSARKTEEAPTDTQQETPKKRARPGDKAPRTLANVPNAAAVSVSDGKYSSIAQRLENADAAEYERILGSMSPEEAEAFASMDV
ncbi:hypothetical protein [Yoonia sp.]|uniref:hypothetical protein n=1 Tax=Yoonia sp. TaxID=2212373 RepID=UPI002E0022FE|nr:hypothetical protein [Yoonia sp.]